MSGEYLIDNPNPNAPMVIQKGGGIFQAWGYPLRMKMPDLIVVHTAEALDPVLEDGDSTAENVANYLSTVKRKASAHVVVDTDSEIVLLPDEAVAFHCAGYNSRSLGLEIAYRAKLWGQDSEREAALIDLAARVVCRWVQRWEIPLRKLPAKEARRGAKGISSHAALDPARRTDPGENFPWEALFHRCFEVGVGSTTDDLHAEDVATQTVLSPLQMIQDGLKTLDYYDGRIDGIPGPRTAHAARHAIGAARSRIKGRTGAWKKVQEGLVGLGFPTAPDDLPGPKTAEALRAALVRGILGQ